MRTPSAHQILIALDQFVNTLFGGYADETLSARVYRNAVAGRSYAKVCRYLLDLMFTPVSRDHCELSFRHELERLQLPPSYRIYFNDPNAH